MNKLISTNNLALLYLFIPVALFLWNWFELYYSIPTIGLTVYCIYVFFREKQIQLSKNSLCVIVLLVAAWVLLAGLGGYLYQNEDHLYRNAVLRDLTNYEWPVVYYDDAGVPAMLCYYLTYWLPSALVGKIGGLDTAQLALYLWTLAGMLLMVRLACNTQPRHAILLVLYLIFCGGADIVPYAAIHPESISPCAHMEWYTSWQYSSITTCLFWVFNQAVPAWICTLLIIDRQSTFAQKVFLSGFMYCYAPFPFIGIVMYVALDCAAGAWLKYRKCASVKGWIAEELRLAYSKQKIPYLASSVAIILLGCSYFGCAGRGIPIFIHHHFTIWQYSIFCFTEFLIPVGIMLAYHYQVRRVMICGLILLFLPWVQIVSFPDYVMRVSIPALLILFLSFFSFMMEHRKNKKLLTICTLYIVICSGVSCTEIARSIYKSVKGNHTPQYVKLIKSHCRDNFTSFNFMEKPYYKYFMRHTERLTNITDSLHPTTVSKSKSKTSK